MLLVRKIMRVFLSAGVFSFPTLLVWYPARQSLLSLARDEQSYFARRAPKEKVSSVSQGIGLVGSNEKTETLKKSASSIFTKTFK